MNSSDLLLTAPVTTPNTLETKSGAKITAKAGNISADSVKSADARRTEKVAKEFESVLLSKVLDEMKNTIGNGFGDEEVGGEQIKGLFWLCLARDMGEKGGIGLWKDLNRFFKDMQKTSESASSLDEKL